MLNSGTNVAVKVACNSCLDGFPIGTNCTPFLANILFDSYRAEFYTLSSLCSQRERDSYCSITINNTYRYINDVSSINHTDFADYLGQMYFVELEIKDKNQHFFFSPRFTTVVRDGGQFHTSIYDKRGDSNFPIKSFLFQ